MSDVQVYYTGNMARVRSSVEERDFGAHANKVVLYSDYAALQSKLSAVQAKAERLARSASECSMVQTGGHLTATQLSKLATIWMPPTKPE